MSLRANISIATCLATMLLLPPSASAVGAAGLQFSSVSIFDESLPFVLLGGLYAVSGTGTFLVLDTVRLSRHKPFPPALAWVQAGYGMSLVGLGVVSSEAYDVPAMSAALIGAGATLALLPLAEWSVRSPAGAQTGAPPTVTFQAGPSGVLVTGRF